MSLFPSTPEDAPQEVIPKRVIRKVDFSNISKIPDNLIKALKSGDKSGFSSALNDCKSFYNNFPLETYESICARLSQDDDLSLRVRTECFLGMFEHTCIPMGNAWAQDQIYFSELKDLPTIAEMSKEWEFFIESEAKAFVLFYPTEPADFTALEAVGQEILARAIIAAGSLDERIADWPALNSPKSVVVNDQNQKANFGTSLLMLKDLVSQMPKESTLAQKEAHLIKEIQQLLRVVDHHPMLNEELMLCFALGRQTVAKEEKFIDLDQIELKLSTGLPCPYLPPRYSPGTVLVFTPFSPVQKILKSKGKLHQEITRRMESACAEYDARKIFAQSSFRPEAAMMNSIMAQSPRGLLLDDAYSEGVESVDQMTKEVKREYLLNLRYNRLQKIFGL